MEQSIAFAHYKNGELLGWRQDSFGTVGKKSMKIYQYSKDQVETVLRGIRSNLGRKKDGFGDALEKIGADPKAVDIIKKAEDKIYEEGQKLGAFEVRVEKAPQAIYEKEFDVKKAEYVTSMWPTYNQEEINEWLQHPENHEVMETHYFSMEGQVSLQ